MLDDPRFDLAISPKEDIHDRASSIRSRDTVSSLRVKSFSHEYPISVDYPFLRALYIEHLRSHSILARHLAKDLRRGNPSTSGSFPRIVVALVARKTRAPTRALRVVVLPTVGHSSPRHGTRRDGSEVQVRTKLDVSLMSSRRIAKTRLDRVWKTLPPVFHICNDQPPRETRNRDNEREKEGERRKQSEKKART